MAVMLVIDKLRGGNFHIAVPAHQHYPTLQCVQHCLHLLAIQRLLGVVDAQQQVLVGILCQADIDRHLRRLGHAVMVANRRVARQRLPPQAVGEDHRQRRGTLAEV
ncbi:hypothetical protein D3C71_1651840 [compost metagenome]